MASALQTLIDGPRNLVVKATGTGAVTAELIVDVSTYVPACTRVRIIRASWFADAALLSGTLLWDATTDVTAITLNNPGGEVDFSSFGGLINNAGTGITGDIMLTTTGTGNYSLVLEMVKSGIIDLDNY